MSSVFSTPTNKRTHKKFFVFLSFHINLTIRFFSSNLRVGRVLKQTKKKNKTAFTHFCCEFFLLISTKIFSTQKQENIKDLGKAKKSLVNCTKRIKLWYKIVFPAQKTSRLHSPVVYTSIQHLIPTRREREKHKYLSKKVAKQDTEKKLEICKRTEKNFQTKNVSIGINKMRKKSCHS